MRFGPRWRALREVRVGRGEVLVTLELGAAFTADLERYRLHPALLDLALTCGLELPELGAWSGLWVPVSWRSVRVHAPLPARVLAWARLQPVDHEGASVLTFDVAIADEQGQVLVEADGFALRQLPVTTTFGAPAPAPARTSAPAPSAGRDLAQTTPAQSNGAHHDRSPGRAALRRNYEQGLTPAEGLAVIRRLLAAGAPSPLLATSLDLDDLRRQAAALAVQPAAQPLPPAGEGDGDDELGAPDSIERTLAGFWRELLGVRRVRLHDSFFDLGGHSLIAVRLFARIRKAFDVDFPISLLFEAPTIARCADAIRRARGESAGGGHDVRVLEPAHRHLVPMHPGQGGSEPPFFLVAGMFGNVLNLRHLAHLLGHERPVYGLQAQGLYGTQQPHETVEEMAAAYIAELRSVHPHGPWLLGGFSGGGITAFEMARQLLAAGGEVALLVMLDTYLPHRPALTASDRTKIHWDLLLARGPAHATEWLRDRVRWEIAKIRKGKASEPPLPSEFRSEAVGEAFRRAVQRYALKPYAGRIALFRPRLEVAHVLGPGRVTNAKRVFLYHDNGWGPWCAGVDVHEVPGDHDSMVLEPHVRVLAGRLRRCIESIEPAAARTA